MPLPTTESRSASQPDASPDFTYVDTAPALEALTEILRRVDQAAVDTEADSLHHYFEKVCLMQISTQGRHFVVDPLAPVDLTPLLDLLSRRRLMIHGADYDLRMMRSSFGFEPRRAVFDTMLAAQLLGQEQFGFAALVKRYFGVVLPKEGQKWDWSRRPLQPRQCGYAANDTRYLESLALLLEKELEQTGRLEWHRETCESMVRSTAQARQRDPDADWRIKGSSTLTPHGLALLKAIWEWRDVQARATDLPPFKVLNNHIILEIVARMLEKPGSDLGQLGRLPRNLVGRRLAGLQKAVAKAEKTPPSQWPGPRKHKGPRPDHDRDDETLIHALQRERDHVAARLELPASVLAPRSVILEIARARPQSLEAMVDSGRILGWQARELAPVWLPILTTPRS